MSHVRRNAFLSWPAARGLLVAPGILLLLMQPPANAGPPPPHYVVTGVTLTDLGTLGGTDSVAYDIDNHGHIVGWSTTKLGNRSAFYFTGSRMIDIGKQASAQSSEASGINDLEMVVGYVSNGTSRFASRWWGSAFDLLDGGFIPNFVDDAEAVAISNSGWIVGERSTPMGVEGRFWIDPFNFLRLSTNSNSRVKDVNDSGVVIGHDAVQATRWSVNGVRFLSDPLPGVRGQSGDIAPMGINSSGAIVGDFDPGSAANVRHVYYWDGVSPSAVDLGAISSGYSARGNDINDRGFIAGEGDRVIVRGRPPHTTQIDRVATLFHPGFGFYELPLLSKNPSSGCSARALNERHPTTRLVQLVGYCRNSAGNWRAVRWDVTVAREEITPEN